MSDQLNVDLKKFKNPAIRNMRWGFNLLSGFFIVFLLGYSWLSWQGVKSEQSRELSSIAELGGNSLDSYFDGYEHAFKGLAEELMDEYGSNNITQSHPRLKRFLHARVYHTRLLVEERDHSAQAIEKLFDYFLLHPDHLPQGPEDLQGDPLQRRVCDYIASMTDGYFLRIYRQMEAQATLS